MINLKTEIASKGYRRMPNLNSLEDSAITSHSHKVYQITYGTPDIEELSSNANLTSDLIILRVLYICKNNDEFDSNYQLFKSDIFDSVKSLNKFAGLSSMSYEPKGEKQSIGEIQFYYGYRSC